MKKLSALALLLMARCSSAESATPKPAALFLERSRLRSTHSQKASGYGHDETIMNRKALTMILMSSLLPSASTGQQIHSRDLALARDYVFVSCVINRYPGTALATEADAWAAGLVEQGNLPSDAYPALARFAHTAPEPGTTRLGVTMRLQSCMDFINVKNFEDRLRRVLQRPTNQR